MLITNQISTFPSNFDIYCHGSLLDAVQNANVFKDSKEFVDMPMKEDPEIILNALQNLPNLSTESLQSFLDKYFLPAGSDLVVTDLKDFVKNPVHFKTRVANPVYLEWMWAIHNIWGELGRKTAITNPLRHSLISKRHAIVVPGGRFRESYYWDSFWIVEGLLISGMQETAKGIVLNLLDEVQLYGFVPNGGRIYYLNRSQPPMLSEMVRLLLEQNEFNPTTDESFLTFATETLDKEYQFWMTPDQHCVTIQKKGKTFSLNRYYSNSTIPRPESYREDLNVTSFSTPENKAQVFQDITAAAESGWDFSGRWFRDHQNLNTICTSDIIPVELNAILYKMEMNLANFHSLLGNINESEKYKIAAKRRVEAMDEILWNNDKAMWMDYSLTTQQNSNMVSISNFIPLWAKSYDVTDETRKKRILQSLLKSGLIDKGGIQTTIHPTGQQWDAPNAWPPLQDMMIDGLFSMNFSEASSLAESLIERWIHTSYEAWKETHHMYEKYNATIIGGLGGGGEYDLQDGFGWTNGIMLKFLYNYAEKFPSIVAPEIC